MRGKVVSSLVREDVLGYEAFLAQPLREDLEEPVPRHSARDGRKIQIMCIDIGTKRFPRTRQNYVKNCPRHR